MIGGIERDDVILEETEAEVGDGEEVDEIDARVGEGDRSDVGFAFHRRGVDVELVSGRAAVADDLRLARERQRFGERQRHREERGTAAVDVRLHRVTGDVDVDVGNAAVDAIREDPGAVGSRERAAVDAETAVGIVKRDDERLEKLEADDAVDPFEVRTAFESFDLAKMRVADVDGLGAVDAHRPLIFTARVATDRFADHRQRQRLR